MTITQLIYASKASTETRPNIEEILKSSRVKNKQSQLTGFLCFRDDMFLQAFEGAPGLVSALYARIANDRRHSNVVILGCEKVVRRRFSTWSMGYLADFGDAQSTLFSYSGQNEFDPYGMDYRNAIEFLSEVANVSGRTGD
jgi:inosine/xanthosine triphosphate pyrophosphatase family protein